MSSATTINDFVATIPVNSGSTLYSVGRRGADNIGAAQFNLRNLGAGSTLVLINGRRAGKSPLADDLGNQFYDLNQLPLPMVKRLDIQTDGASAIYGSEAVAGVVNVVTRLGFEGFEISGRKEWAENNSETVNLAFGTTTDNGRFAAYATMYQSDMLFNSDLDWTGWSSVCMTRMATV